MADMDGGSKRRRDGKRLAPGSEQAHLPGKVFDFIELVPFSRRWAKLGLDDENDLLALQLRIMASPTSAPVIRGTAGLRKLRFSPPGWHAGKSGSTRVLYVYFEKLNVVLLCLVYGKNEIDNISDRVKTVVNRQIAEVEHELRRLRKQK